MNFLSLAQQAFFLKKKKKNVIYVIIVYWLQDKESRVCVSPTSLFL